jgi:RNA polymerase sigma-70 factor (ECF subfamily)
MAALAEGEESALEGLMDRFQNDIFRFCLHYLRDVERARDLTQETFIRVYTASSRFDESRKFKPWLLCIARNLCLNELKRRKTVPMESFEEYASTPRADSAQVLRADTPRPDERAISDERLQVLSEALETLSEEAREIVTLRFFERMSAKEIGEIVGSTEGAVRTKLHRILAGLRQEYQTVGQDL